MLLKLKDNVSNFINSFQFTGIIFFLSAIFFVLGIQLAQFIIVIVLACFIFLFQKDTTPIFSLVIAFIISVRDFSALGNISLCLWLFIPVVISIIIHFALYCRSFSFGTLSLPLFFVSIIALIGGITSPHKTPFAEGILYKFVCGVIPLFVYLIFTNTIDNKKIRDYLPKVLILLTIAVSFETIALMTNSFYSIIDDGYVSYCELGWLNTGFGAYFYHFGIASCFFYITKCKFQSPFILLLIYFLFILFIAESDAPFAISCILLPIYILFSYLFTNKTNRKKILLISIICVVTALILLICFIITPLFEMIFDVKLDEYIECHFKNDTHRSEMYRDGWFLFTSSKIFGSGFGSVYHTGNWFIDSSGYMHSTLIQVMCSMGIVGLLAYIYYFIKRIAIFTKKFTSFNVFMFIGFISYQTVAMVDNAEFSFLTVFITIITVFVEQENKSGNPEIELPLYKQVC